MLYNTTDTEPAVNGHPKEEKEGFFSESKKLLEQYIQDRILLLKLEVSKTAATASASIANGVLLALFGLLALIFVSITLGFVFTRITGSFIWGFGIVSAIYIALIITVIVARKWLTKKVANAVISSIYSKKKEEKIKDDSDTASKN
jgi:hypothetical protein